MSKFLLKSLKNNVKTLRSTSCDTLLETHDLLYLCLQTQHSFSSLSAPKRNSFAVDYLIKSCGFTPERAVLASKYVKFKVADKPDSVLTFFKDHGFTQTQISKVVVGYPQLLVSNAQKTVLPKLEFLKSKGFSNSDVVACVAKWPGILTRSLRNQLIPNFNCFNKLLLSCERKNIIASTRCAGVLLLDLEKRGVENIELLKKTGVPLKNIGFFLANQPRIFSTNCDKFRQTVDEVMKLGFDPSEITFMTAVHALRSMTKSTWDRKVEMYKKWGWSDDDIAVAFRKSPWCMTKSEDKITMVMEFWVNKMGCKSSVLAKIPLIMSFSLEKRIAPRWEVYQFLVSNGLLSPDDTSFTFMLKVSETCFIKRFVEPYKKEAPGLLTFYKQKLDLAK